MMYDASDPAEAFFVHQDDYQIAIVCALRIEADAIELSLDDIYDINAAVLMKAEGDRNSYTTGRIGPHNVVLVHMPGIGNINAAAVAVGLQSTFRNIALALVVGICGGAPETPNGQQIYLGDVIISTQVLQGDFGREQSHCFVVKNTEEGNLGQASATIRSFLNKLQGPSGRARLQRHAIEFTEMLLPDTTKKHLSIQQDVLFPAHVLHKHRKEIGPDCAICSIAEEHICPRSSAASCEDLGCFLGSQVRSRLESVGPGPSVHFGTVSSTNAIKRSGVSRDSFAKQHKVIAFETEGAGVWDVLPTIVVKGVCDYADSHKNKQWQEYASITAAATCKGLVQQWLRTATSVTRRVSPLGLEANPDELKRKAYLSSLDIGEIDSRFHNIRFAYPQTCDWLLRTKEFKSWLDVANRDTHHGVLWIKGKPGSGKSTLMKHIHQYCQEHASHPNDTLLTFFFNASGTDNQKTQLGMLRSLVHQILCKNTTTLDHFISIFPAKRGSLLENRQWTSQELQHFLCLSAQRGWISNTTVLIDAVDECDRLDARMLVDFCEDLAAYSMQGNSLFYICFSIRNFPELTMNKCLELRIDHAEEHTEAIRRYVSAKLRVENSAVREMVLKKANHVFLWVILVVQMLNDEYDKGSNVKALVQRLQQAPPDLYSMFAVLLNPVVKHEIQTVLILSLVLHTFQPMDPSVLHALVVAGTTNSRSREQSYADITTPGLQRFVNNFSRGLLEISWTREALSHQLQQGKVQFIHESVADYLRAAQRNPQADMSIDIWNESSCHAHIAKCCLNSMRSEELPHNKEELIRRPHMIYSLQYLLSHIGSVVEESEMKAILMDYSQIFESWSWYYRSNWPKFIDGDFAICSVILPYDSTVKSNGTRERILKCMVQIQSQTTETVSNYSKFGHALYAAVHERWSVGVAILLQAGADVGAINSRYKDILVPLYEAMSRFRPNHIVDDGTTDILELLLIAKTKAGKPINNVPTLKTVPLIEAIVREQRRIIEILLEARPNLNVSDKELGTPLIAAIRKEDAELCKKLLIKGADANLHHDRHGHALIQAVRTGRLELVKTVLDFGADVNLVYDGYDHALPASAARGLVDITTTLLEHGADVNTTCGPRGAALPTALTYGHANIAQILIKNGADPNARNVQNETPLILAVKAGFPSVVDALLKAGSDPNSSSFVLPNYNAAAQHVAVLLCRVDVLRVLTSSGITLDLQDQDGNTVLDLAQASGENYERRAKSIFEDIDGGLSQYHEVVNKESRQQVIDVLGKAAAKENNCNPRGTKRKAVS